MESICAVIFTIILMFPLIIQLQMLIVDPKKLCKVFHYYATSGGYENGEKNSTPKLLQYYPKVPILFDATSDSTIAMGQLRTISSSPALPHKTTIKENEKPFADIIPAIRHSSSFVKTNEVLPMVDITWNYNSYRYKAFEDSLRNQYGNNYPPGKVVLNSMQLNLPNSKTKIGQDYGCSLFDFAKESDVALNDLVSRKLEIEYLNPLDHFVMKQLERPVTEEKFTETLDEEKDHEASIYDETSSEVPIKRSSLRKKKI